MRKRFFIYHILGALLVLVILNSISGQASAELWELNRYKNNKAAFLAGFFGGYAAHELGHIMVADSIGFDADVDGVTIVYPGAIMTDAEQLQVSSAGFQVQWLVSECVALPQRQETD